MLTRKKMDEIKATLEAIQTDLKNKATCENIEDLKRLIKEKDTKIEALEKKVDELESKLSVIDRTNELLSRKIDDGEQYQRRSSRRVNGIPSDKDEVETGEICLKKVKEEVSKLGIDPTKLQFDRAHRVGFVKKDASGNPLPRPMIFRMTSWADRTLIYKARDKQKGAKIKFYIDLTKRRLDLKTLAIERVQEYPNVDFVFADINCNLCVRFKSGAFKFFNSEEELEQILNTTI